MVSDCYPRLDLDREGKSLDQERNATGRERVFLHLSTGPRPGRGNWSTGTLAYLANASIGSSFLARKPIFYGLFTSSTWARSLSKIICQF